MFKQGDRVVLVSQEGSVYLQNIPVGSVGEIRQVWFSYTLNRRQAAVVFTVGKAGDRYDIDVDMTGCYLRGYAPTVRLATEEEWLAHDVKILRKQVKELNKVKLPMIERLKVLQAAKAVQP